MSNERLQILRMVEEGKVSAEEAAKLLDALEQPARPDEPRPRHIRVTMLEGGKTKNFSIGIGLASWALSVAGSFSMSVGETRVDKALLEDAIARGVTGKILEAAEDGKRIEVWLEA